MQKHASLHSRALVGIEAAPVEVQIHISGGLPRVTLVGLPATAVRESRDRVRSALLSCGFDWPDGHITINLSPADLPKQGACYDLPIALGILAASGQLPVSTLGDIECLGELSLAGELRAVPGSISAARAAQLADRSIVLSERSAQLAALIPGVRCYGAGDLLQLCAHLRGTAPLALAQPALLHEVTADNDLSDVRGQPGARRALELCAGGGHNLLLVGPPGSGKTMLASRLPGLLPDLNRVDAVDSLIVASLGAQEPQYRVHRPFRAPHHSCSHVALVGGGRRAQPGEATMAHNGVLFLDELPEFPRRGLEALRKPLESGVIEISRADYKLRYPARFQLVAAMNPCPCGYAGDPGKNCNCSAEQQRRYAGRVSGPLLDRIDVQLAVSRPASADVLDAAPGESTDTVRRRVAQVQQRQLERQGRVNAQLDNTGVRRHCILGREDRRYMERIVERQQLSARACLRTLRVARTLADMEQLDDVGRAHLNEALAYRRCSLLA